MRPTLLLNKNLLYFLLVLFLPALTSAGCLDLKCPGLKGGFFDDGLLTFSDTRGNRVAKIAFELADTPVLRQRGLMFRSEMEECQGMLFYYEKPKRLAFWMKNTPLSLDIIFIGTDRRILKIIKNTVPFSETLHESGVPASIVVEVKSGFCERHRITEGFSFEWRRCPPPQ